MKWFSVFSYRTFYYRSIAALIVGIVALFVPNDTLNVLVMLIGAFILLAGVGTAITAHRMKHNLLLSLAGVASIVTIVIGVALILRPDLFLKMVITVFAIILILVGLLQIVNVANMRSEIQSAKFYIAGGLVPLAIGIILLVFQEQIKDVIGIILGITLIIYALNELGLGFKMRKHFKPKAEPEIEDAPFEEVVEE